MGWLGGQGNPGVSGQWWQADMGSNVTVTGVQIWNGAGNYVSGVQSLNILACTDVNCGTSPTTIGTLTATAWSASATAPPSGVGVMTATASARYLRLNFTAGFGCLAGSGLGVNNCNTPGLAMVNIYTGSSGTPPQYGMNDYVGRTRRVSNTSGTILIAEYAALTITTSPDSTAVSPYTYNTTFLSNYGNVQGPASRSMPPTPGGNGSGTTGLLNVGFVDGHCDLFNVVTISPATGGAGDLYWNNYGASRSD